MISRITKLMENHSALQKAPTSKEDIFNNQRIRYSSVKEIKTSDGISPEDKQAMQKFWCMQTYFFIRCLHAKKSEIAKFFPDVLLPETLLSKKNLVLFLEKVIEELNKKSLSNEEIRSLIALFVPPNTAAPAEKKEKGDRIPKSELPRLYIQKKDSITFSYEQAAKNKKVLIMDAANTQRPGAGAYEKGTFQEALTRSTNLYWKVLVDFRNVLQNLQEQKKTVVNIEEKDYETVTVAAFQARFLKLIFFFIKKSIEDETYLEKNYFRKDFFDYAEGIYGDIQNQVLEIPTDSGFLKETYIVNVAEFKKFNKTSDLFNKEEIFSAELLEERLPNLFIAEVAAPDKRYLEGSYDRASTFDKDLQVSHQDAGAAKMIKHAIYYTLQQAIQKDVDIIIVNGFGCGAFRNSSEEVANIFSEALAKHQLELRGKSIYFMDISLGMCLTFGNVFSKNLRESFNINFYPQGKNTHLNVLLDKLEVKSITQENAVVFAADNSRMIKPFTFFKEPPRSSVVRPIKDLEDKPKTKLTLKEAYSKAILSAIEEKKTVIHMPLIGTGKLKFLVSDSVIALQETLQELEQRPSFPGVKVYVYIPTQNIRDYHAIIEYLAELREQRIVFPPLSTDPALPRSCSII